MVARWSANPRGALWPETDATFVSSGSDGARVAGCGTVTGRDSCDRLKARRNDRREQIIGRAVVAVTPGDYFEFIAQETPPPPRTTRADEFAWSAIEVVE